MGNRSGTQNSGTVLFQLLYTPNVKQVRGDLCSGDFCLLNSILSMWLVSDCAVFSERFYVIAERGLHTPAASRPACTAVVRRNCLKGIANLLWEGLGYMCFYSQCVLYQCLHKWRKG